MMTVKTKAALLLEIASHKSNLVKPSTKCWLAIWHSPVDVYHCKKNLLNKLDRLLRKPDDEIALIAKNDDECRPNIVEECLQVASSSCHYSPLKPAVRAYLPLLLDIKKFMNTCKLPTISLEPPASAVAAAAA